METKVLMLMHTLDLCLSDCYTRIKFSSSSFLPILSHLKSTLEPLCLQTLANSSLMDPKTFSVSPSLSLPAQQFIEQQNLTCLSQREATFPLWEGKKQYLRSR